MKDIQLLCKHIPWHCGSWSRHLTQAGSTGLPQRNFGLKTRSWVSPSLVAKVAKFKSQNSYCLHIDEAILWRQRPGSQEETSRDGVIDTRPPPPTLVFYYLILCFQKNVAPILLFSSFGCSKTSWSFIKGNQTSQQAYNWLLKTQSVHP